MYWKKCVGMHMRKNKRSALVKSRKILADHLREQRRQKREAREALGGSVEGKHGKAVAVNDQPSDKIRFALLLVLAIAAGALGGPPTWREATSRIRLPL